jgi:hypothetical protein
MSQTIVTDNPADFPVDVAECYVRDVERSGANGFSRAMLDVYLNRNSPHADDLVAVIDAAGWVKGLPWRVRHNLIWKYAHGAGKQDGTEPRAWEAMPGVPEFVPAE